MPTAINNARAEKLRSSGFWRESFERRRRLIPASSFCEAAGKRPAVYHWFALTEEDDRPPFAFAGIWRRYRGIYKEEPVEHLFDGDERAERSGATGPPRSDACDPACQCP